MERIFTHKRIDLDAAFSVLAYQRLAPGGQDKPVVFINADWDGTGMRPGDVALDIDAGGMGLKGDRDADGTVHSCLVGVLQQWGDVEAKRVLRPLVTFVEAHEVSGNAVLHLTDGSDESGQLVVYGVSLPELLNGFHILYPGDDFRVLGIMRSLFDALWNNGSALMAAETVAMEASTWTCSDGKFVAHTRSSSPLVARLLFARGAVAVVYSDGKDVGISRNRRPEYTRFRVDGAGARAVIEAAGEAIGRGGTTWFAHPAGYLLCRGSPMAPAPSPSLVRALDLVNAVLGLYKEFLDRE